MENRGQNPLWLLIVVFAFIIAALVVYLFLLPTVCTLFEPIAAEPIC